LFTTHEQTLYSRGKTLNFTNTMNTTSTVETDVQDELNQEESEQDKVDGTRKLIPQAGLELPGVGGLNPQFMSTVQTLIFSENRF